jgi:hypothetical protein
MDKSKTFCDICRISIPNNYLGKHQASERHLRSKAAKMFYKSKSSHKNPYKQAKYDEGFLDDLNNNSGPGNLQVTTISSKVKGVWALVNDLSTGKILYKNRLSGKTQHNKPFGLNEEDLEQETFESIVYQKHFIPENSPSEEFEEPEIGKWVDTDNSYWFGGTTRENLENDEENQEYLQKNLEIESNSRSLEDYSDQDSKKSISSNEIQQSKIEITEKLKQNLETQEIEAEIISKPTFIHNTSAPSSFKKRSQKGKSLISLT